MPAAGISTITMVGVYVYANVLLLAAALLLAGMRALDQVLLWPMTYRHILATGRALAAVALALPILAVWHGGSEVSALKAQVWAGPSMAVATHAVGDDAQIAVGTSQVQTSFGVDVAQWAVLAFVTGGLMLVLLPAAFQARGTSRSIRDAHVLRCMRSVRILVSDYEPVPFALWIPGRYYIILPAAMLLLPEDVRMALRHEGQHHRQGDTRYMYLALLVRALFGLNPAVHWLMQQLHELEELACDEAIAQRPDHCTDAYCACLLRVADAALNLEQSPLRFFMASRHADTLRHRIEAIVRAPRPGLRSPAAIAVSVAAAALLTMVSAAISAPIEDRRISRADAEQLVASTPDSAAWGLRANEAVRKQLNLLLGTPDGRIFLLSSIARMRTFEPGVVAELKRYGLPTNLAVVPLVESGYLNRPAHNGAGAGLWMFIGTTAERYGLYVAGNHDERLDAAAETHAAARMFSDLRNRFRDWPLALMAYNAGVARIVTGMSATRSKDAWKVSAAGYGNDPDYLARTAAMMLIISHPQILN